MTGAVVDNAEHQKYIAEQMHRVKNNFQLVLSLINLQSDFAALLSKEEASMRLMTRVHAIALVQELLYLDYRRTVDAGGDTRAAGFELRELILRLIDYASGVYGESAYHSRMRIELPEGYELGSHEGVAAALIFNELIVNNLVHGPRGNGIRCEITGESRGEALIIQIRQANSSCRLENNVPAPAGLGSILVENYLAQLNGRVEYANSDGDFVITLSLPRGSFHPLT